MKDLGRLLHIQKQNSRYRSREILTSPQGVHICLNGKNYLNFSSNDYLGLANDPEIVKAFNTGAAQFGVGSGAAHLIAGHTSLHHDLEQALAEHTGRSRALLFSTGYMANLGVITSLCGRGDLVIEDRLNHASLIDGGLFSNAKFKRYVHNDLSALESILQNASEKERLIVTDGVFSMDGDIAPLNDIVSLAKKYNADVLVDDAHGFGVLGPQGGGICDELSLQEDDQPILMATLGKALGCFGAFIAGSENLIEWLIQEARTYVYTTALPPAVAAAGLASLHIIQNQPERREHLQALIHLFRNGAEKLDLNLLPSQTAIQPVIVGDEVEAMRWSDKLREQGFIVKAIRPPTVPKGTSRLRITLSAAHSEQDVMKLLTALGKFA